MINVSLRSEIMKDYVPGSELAGDRDIAAAMQKNGTLLLFSVGVDDHVYMLAKAPGSSTGWERTDLSEDLPAGVRTLHLCAAQAIDGSPILAIATAPKSGAERTVYVATDFTPARKPGRWAQRGSCVGSEITAMTTGSTVDGRPVVVVATVNAQRQLSTFFLHPDPGGKETVWKEVPLPLNGSGVLDMAIGHSAKLEAKIPGLEGLIYTLLRVDDVTTRLIVTSFPDFSIYNHVVPVTISPVALAAIGLPSGDTQLFLGTDSLYGLSPEQQTTQDATKVSEAATKIVSMGPGASARTMCAGRHPDGRLEIWWLNQNGILTFVEEKPAGGWGQPIGLQKQVGEMTAWRNPVTSEIDIFTVDQEHSLTHLSQDQTTTLWSARSILLPVSEDDLTKTTQCNSYTTQVTLSDADGSPLANQTVRISASSLSLIAIDGSHFFVDQSGQFATIATNALGMFSVTTLAKGLTTPKIRLAGDFMKEVIDFDPKATVANRLKSINADNLRGATVTRGGAKVPLIPARQSSQLSNAADALRQLVKVQSRLAQPGKADDVTVDVGDAGPQSYDIRPAVSTVTTSLDFSHLPNGTVLTLPVAAAPSARLAAPQGIFDPIEVSFGDIWNAIKNGLVKVANIIIKKVDDGLRIVINGLESAFSAVLKFAEQVWDVVEWVFNQIGAVIDEIIEWLRFLFEWGDILNTHVVMRKMTQLALNYIGTSISSVESKIAAALDTLKPTLAQKSLKWPANGVSHLSIAAVAKGGKAHSLTNDTRTSWIASKVNRHTVGRASSTHSDLPSDSITKTLEGIGDNEIKAIQAAYDEIVVDIAKNIMKFDLEEIFKRVVAAFTDALIDTVQNVTAVVCDVTKLAIEAIDSILNAHIDIPVITWLYENVVSPGSKLTILDVSCLIAAIPATVLCKLVADKAPFSSAQAKALNEADTLDSFQGILSAQFRTAPRAAHALTDSKGATSVPWEVTAVLSCIAAGSRFCTALLSTVAMFLKEGKPLKWVNIFSSTTKALTAAISISTTLIAPAKNLSVFILESAVLGVIVSTVIISFLSIFYPEMSAFFYGLNVGLGALGFILVCTNYGLASFVEPDVSDTQRGLKFGMVASMFIAVILNIPANVKTSENPIILAAYYIIKSASLFCLYSSFALNVTRSALSFKNKIPYVDI